MRARFERLDPERIGMAAALTVIVVLAAFRALEIGPWSWPTWDLWAYWLVRDGLDYGAARQGDTGPFLYSPAAAQAIWPLVRLPWPWFAAVWTVLAALPLVWLAGRWSLGSLLLLPVAMSVGLGQIDLLFGVVALAGLRWPALWAVPILTKVTPGVGIVWFAARQEWRRLAIAIGATLAIAAISFAIAPAAWLDWLAFLARADFPDLTDRLLFLPVPLWLRLPAAAVLIAWGARTDRVWVLPLGVLFAEPTMWVQSPTVLLALLPLAAVGATTPAGRWLRSNGLIALPGTASAEAPSPPATTRQERHRRPPRRRPIVGQP
jgi:hypothetical protein